MESPHFKRVVLGFTTIPVRVKHIGPVIDSIRAQTRHPDNFYISVPEFSSRENKRYPLEELAEHVKGVGEVNLVPMDYGPLTKLMGLLLAERDKPKELRDATVVITIDDDHVLHPRFVEELVTKAEQYYGDVVAFCAQNVSSKTLSWSTTDPKKKWFFNLPDGHRVNIVCGVGGVAYPLHRFDWARVPDPDLEAYRVVGTDQTILNLTRHDDMYISSWMARLGVTKRSVRFSNRENPTVTLPYAFENALCAFDNTRTLGRSAGHLVQWLTLAKTLIDMGLLEQGYPTTLEHNISGMAAVGVAMLTVVAAVGLYAWFSSKKKKTIGQ
jgi:hypothetical protein